MTDSVVAVNSRQLEERIEKAVSQLKLHLPGVEAEFRCQICYSLISDHPENKVKGCNRPKLVGQEYIDSLYRQCQPLERAVTMVENLQGYSIMEAELVQCRFDMKQLEEQKKEQKEELLSQLNTMRATTELRESCIRTNFAKTTDLIKSLNDLFLASTEGSISMRDAKNEFDRVLEFMTSAANPYDLPPPSTLTGSGGKPKRKSVHFPDGESPISPPATPNRGNGSNDTRPKHPTPTPPPSHVSDSHDSDSSSDSSSSSDDEKPSFGPPGLEEPPINHLLVHETGGAILGGTPNSRECKKSKHFITVKFAEDDSPTVHMKKEKDILRQMRSHYKDSSIYTLVDILHKQSTAISEIIEPMIEQESFFTSFTHFMTELRVRRFPNIQAACLSDYHNLKQGNKSAYDLYLQMLGLLRAMNRDPNQFASDYIQKLAHDDVKKALTMASYDGQNLAEMAKHADKVERTLGLIPKNGGKKKGDASVSSNTNASASSSSSSGGSRGRGRGRGRGSGSNQGDRGAPSGGGGAPSGGGGASSGFSGAVSGARQNPAVKSDHFKQLEKWERPNCCFGCLSPNHKYDAKNPPCKYKRCVFCKKPYGDVGGHPSVACKFRPLTKTDLEKHWEERRNKSQNRSVNSNEVDRSLPISETRQKESDNE